jgi:hypothetical protein
MTWRVVDGGPVRVVDEDEACARTGGLGWAYAMEERVTEEPRGEYVRWLLVSEFTSRTKVGK